MGGHLSREVRDVRFPRVPAPAFQVAPLTPFAHRFVAVKESNSRVDQYLNTLERYTDLINRCSGSGAVWASLKWVPFAREVREHDV